LQYGQVWHRYLRFWGADIDGGIDDELQFHLERRISDYPAAGLPRPGSANAMMVLRNAAVLACAGLVIGTLG
jgi:hypothetical protein